MKKMHQPTVDLNRKILRKSGEEGIAILVVLASILLVLLVMRSVLLNTNASEKERKKISESLNQANTDRFINQMIADDQLCAKSEFMTNLSGFTLTKPSRDIRLEDKNGFVDYHRITNDGRLSWPGQSSEGTAEGDCCDFTSIDNAHIKGKGKQQGVAIYQRSDPDAAVRESLVDGKKIYRIPLVVRPVYNVGAGPVVGKDGNIYAYLETDDALTKIACYRDVSSRSLCIDAGGKFEVGEKPIKCVLKP